MKECIPEERKATISMGIFCQCSSKIESMRWNHCPFCGIKFDWSTNEAYQAARNRVD